MFDRRIVTYTTVLSSALHQRESAVSVHGPLPPTAHPSRLSQSTRFELPASLKFPLAICFAGGNVDVSMLLSQFTPPSPSAAVSTGLFSASPFVIVQSLSHVRFFVTP